MKLKVTSGWFLLMAVLGPSGASALPDRSTPDVPMLRVRLSAPGHTSLAESEIRNAVSGKELLLDEAAALAPGLALDIVMEGGCPPIEKFYPDGGWERGICARTYVVEHGHWSIRTDQFGSQLCTAIDGEEANCRAVWRRSSLDRLILTVNAKQSDGNPEYNPYRTAPL
jgi:hypothetical protein